MAKADLIQVEERPEALVVTVLRRTLDEPGSLALHDRLLALAPTAGPRPFILDLSSVEFAPSVAIGVLVKLSKAFRLDRRRLLLAGVQPRVYKTLAVTGVTRLLEIQPTVADARAAVGRDAP
jgi:anti-anti-sigma factor